MRIFCLNLFFGKRPTIYEDGNQLRDYINIRDVINANLLVLRKKEADFQTYNVGGGKAYTVKEFYKQVAQIFKRDINPNINNEYRYGDTRHIISDISKIRELGWKPNISIEQSIEEYKQYIEEVVDIEDVLDFQRNRMKDSGIVRKIAR